MRRATEAAAGALLSWAVLAAVAVAPALAPAGARTADGERSRATGAPAAAVAPTGAVTPPAAGAPRAARSVAVAPIRVAIAAIGVDAPVAPLGLLGDGRLAAPADPHVVGWWRGGPAPGRAGAAVLAGHVDDRSGPAVFARLGALRRGDAVVVTDARGARTAWRVTAVERHPKDRLPTHRVHRRSAAPLLRLVTCGGAFDRATGHYRDNVVVFAVRA